MSRNSEKRKHANDNNNCQAEIQPTDRLDFLAAIAMDNDITAKQSMAVRVAAVVLKHRHNQTGLIVLKYKTIAKEIGCSVSAVRDAVELLKDLCWFEVEHVYRDGDITANRYKPCWDLAAACGGVWCVESRRLLSRGQTPAEWRTDLCPSGDTQNSEVYSRGFEPSASNPVIPERFASGTSDLGFRESASGADRHEKPWPYKQTKAEADQTFERLERMPWKTEADDPTFDPTDKAGASARIHWHRLLKEGIAAWRIERAAQKFMQELPKNQRPCLAGFLGRYARQCIDPEEWLFISDDAEESQSGFANDNEKLDRASGEG